MADCEYCSSEVGAPICGDRIQLRFIALICTRPPDHEGQHVGCGAHHNIAQWGYDEALRRKFLDEGREP